MSYLGTGRRPAPDFPADLLGPLWASWTAQSAAAASSPPDYVGVALLSCAGAALANVRWPIAGAGWTEPPVIWVAEVGSPSTGKSPGMDAAFDLVRHVEDMMASGFDDAHRDYETRKQIAKAKREAWEKEVAAALKSVGTAPPMPDEAVIPDEPIRPRIRVADVTTERLGALAAGLPRGLLLVRDELSGWLGGFDRYGGGGSDRAFALEMYGGRSYVVDRMKSPEPMRIRHLSVGVLGGVQPDKLPAIIDTPDDGLISRVLWAWPDVLPKFILARQPADDIAAKDAFNRLASLPMSVDEAGLPQPRRLPLTSGAESVLEQFAQEMRSRAHDTSGPMAGAIGKARGHVLRLSCILEHLWWSGVRSAPEPTGISDHSVKRAAGLVEGYFLPMAERALGDAAIPVLERRAMTLAQHLRKTAALSFNARDVRRTIGGELREAAHMDAACKTLEEAGLIRPARASDAIGRRPKNYEVNPSMVGAAS